MGGWERSKTYQKEVVHDSKGEEEQAKQIVPTQEGKQPATGKEDGGTFHQEGVPKGTGVALDVGVGEEALVCGVRWVGGWIG